jgi:hypothetical protein
VIGGTVGDDPNFFGEILPDRPEEEQTRVAY